MGRTVIQIVTKPTTRSKLLFWGMNSDFSRQVLENLIAEGEQPAAIVLPVVQEERDIHPIYRIVPQTPKFSLPLKNPFLHNSIFKLAWEHQIPLYKIRDLTAKQTIQMLAEYDPTVAIVACFPKRIPRKVLNLPDAGFLNLHPSLLPQLRGPYPLFWTFRLGVRPGVSVHFMDEDLDTGDIVRQKPLEFPDGISAVDADSIIAKHGASLLVEACRQVAKGDLVRAPQEGEGSTYSRPGPGDFSIPTSWTARRAFNFIRGTADWNHPYLIHGPEFSMHVRSALTYIPGSTHDPALRRNGADVLIPFKDGILHARQ